MKIQPIRTTILIQPGLLQRLKFYSKRQQKPVSEIIEQAVRQLIERSQDNTLDQMYADLFKLAQRGQKGITDASTTVDEKLYGEHGVWKGENE